MKILQVHNWHRLRSGTDVMVRATVEVLRAKGHEVQLLTRDSKELAGGMAGRVRAFMSGIYSPSGRCAMAEAIHEQRPDVVHIHELYPFISPWSLFECREAGVPVVMTCHDYRLSCPVGTHWQDGIDCRLCMDGREYWCVVKNCRDSIPESLAYALRTAVARVSRTIRDNVCRYITPSAFVKHRMVEGGFTAESIDVVPNIVSVPGTPGNGGPGEYIAFAGRITPDKGIGTLIESARQTGLPVRVAGDYSRVTDIVGKAPDNVVFLGLLDRKQLDVFYDRARFFVAPSVWAEPFGLVIAEAMMHSRAVVAARTGGIPELVEDGKTGILFAPGNAGDLSAKIRRLVANPDLSVQMGVAGREKAMAQYNEDIHYQRLRGVYERAGKSRTGDRETMRRGGNG